MPDPRALSGRKLAAPRALLLDFGGVIVETTKVPGWEAALAAEVAERLAGDRRRPGPGADRRATSASAPAPTRAGRTRCRGPSRRAS